MLDALGHDERAGPRRQLHDRAEHRARRAVRGAALDEAEVDLEDVEADLGQEPQAGVAGADVIGREPDAGASAGVDPIRTRVDVVEGWCSVSSTTRRSGAKPCRARMPSSAPLLNSGDSIVVGRQVEAQEDVVGKTTGSRHDVVDAGHVEGRDAPARLRRREEGSRRRRTEPAPRAG